MNTPEGGDLVEASIGDQRGQRRPGQVGAGRSAGIISTSAESRGSRSGPVRYGCRLPLRHQAGSAQGSDSKQGRPGRVSLSRSGRATPGGRPQRPGHALSRVIGGVAKLAGPSHGLVPALAEKALPQPPQCNGEQRYIAAHLGALVQMQGELF